MGNQELQKGILLVQAVRLVGEPIATHFNPVGCQVTVGNKDVTGTQEGNDLKAELLPYLTGEKPTLDHRWGMKVNLSLLGQPDSNTNSNASGMGTRYIGEVEPITNTGIFPNATFGPVTVTLDNESSNTEDVYTFEGGRLMVRDANSKKRVLILCDHTDVITVTLTLEGERPPS